MAFPTVEARTETQIANGTTLAINFGAAAASGDLVVIFLGLSDTAQTITTTESFVNLTNTNATFHIIYKVLDGTEGTSTSVTVGTNTKAAAIAYTITTGTHAAATAPVFSTVATGTDTNPNPGTLSPAGGAKDYLWIAAFRQNGEEADDDTWVASAPTTPGTFTNLLQITSGTGGLPATNGSVASAEYQANTATVDPGTFGNTAQSLAWRAYTLAVYPSPDLTVNAELATALTAAAYGATTLETINAGVAAGTGAALDATVQTAVTANAGLAEGTGTANDATVEVGGGRAWGAWSQTWSNEVDLLTVNAGVAAVAADALTASAAIAPSAGVATGTGAALAPSLAIAASAGVAAGTGLANDATVSTTENVSVNAEVATIAATAYGATTLLTANAAAAATIAAAYNPTAALVLGAGLASVTGTANDATVTTSVAGQVNADVALISGQAYDATLLIALEAVTATATAKAYDIPRTGGPGPSGVGVAPGVTSSAISLDPSGAGALSPVPDGRATHPTPE